MATTYKCFVCGAELHFSPTTQDWACEFCDSHFDASAFEQPEEEKQRVEGQAAAVSKEDAQPVDRNDFSADNGTVIQNEEGEFVSYKCSHCGAEVVATKDTTATMCVYCQRPLVMNNSFKGEFAPSALIPFKYTKEQAIEALEKYIKGKPFIPRDFKERNNIEKVMGIYLPCWLIGTDVVFDMSGSITEADTVTSGKYHVTTTNTYAAKRKGSVHVGGITVDASTKIEDALIDSIQPFKIEELICFNPAYLSGFVAERYDLEDSAAVERVGDKVLTSVETEVMNYTNGNTITGRFVPDITTRIKSTQLQNVATDYVLLPTWLLFTEHEGNRYAFAMNGQTGKFTGNLPVVKSLSRKFALKMFGAMSAITLGLSAILMILEGLVQFG